VFFRSQDSTYPLTIQNAITLLEEAMRIPFNLYAMLDLRCTSILWAQGENILRPAGFDSIVRFAGVHT
jgi:hypothetical protein